MGIYYSIADLEKMLKELAGLFPRLGIPYMLIGGLAVDLWGRPRATLDIDFSILANDADVKKLLSAAAKLSYIENNEWGPYLYLIVRKLQVRLMKNGVNVDVLLQRDMHDVKAMSRRRRKRIGGLSIYVPSPDDLILQKLKVGRPRDFEDALAVMVRSKKDIDFRYLWRWAAKLGIQAELNYIVRGVK